MRRHAQDAYPPAMPQDYSRIGTPRPGPEGPDLDSVRSFLLRRKWSIALATVAVFGAVAAFTHYQPRTYQSNSTFLVESPSQGDNVPVFGVLEKMGRGGRIENEIVLIQSRRVLAPAVDVLDLHVTAVTDDGEFRPGELLWGFNAGRDAEPGRYRIASISDTESALYDAETGEELARANEFVPVEFKGLAFRVPPGLDEPIDLEVQGFQAAVMQTGSIISVARVGRDADMVRLTCTAFSPEEAQALCDEIGKSYIALRAELQRTEATTAKEFLVEQVVALGNRLKEAEDSLEAYGRRNRVVALGDRATEEVKQITQLRAQRDLMEAERSALANFIASVEDSDLGDRKYRDLASFPSFAQNEAVTGLVSSLSELENERVQLAVRRTEANPDLAAVDQRISSIERQLQSIAQSYEAALREQIATLDQNLGRAGASLSVIPTQQIEFARLQRQASQLDELYRMLQNRLREAEIAEAVNLPNVRVVDSPSYALGPSAPRVKVNLLLGLILGLALGLTVALVQERLDKTVRGRHEVERETGLRVLAMLPRVGNPAPVLPVTIQTVSAADGRYLPEHTAESMAGAAGGDRKARKKRSRPFGASAEWSATLEAFRSLATDMKFVSGSNGDRPIRTVAVTSSTKGEGKTFTSCNLALIHTSFGSNTLLIDSDIRAPSIQRFFGLPFEGPGLSEVLSDGVDPLDTWHRLSLDESNKRHLTVMPAGRAGESAAGLLQAPETLAQVLELAQEKFDLVVVDTPPLSMISDSAVVAAAVDAVIFVVRSGRSSPAILETSLQRLSRANQNVLGIVLNDVDQREYYYSYNYSYGDRP
jgi:capsular exopolysaccharide synthesis family protein